MIDSVCGRSERFARKPRRRAGTPAGERGPGRSLFLAAVLFGMLLLLAPALYALAAPPPNPCASRTDGMDCSEAEAAAIAKAGLDYYQSEMPHVQPHLVHYPVEPGQEVAFYCVHWTSPVGCYYSVYYRARVFVDLPQNPCSAYQYRHNCSRARALAVARHAELYYLQRQPGVGAFVQDFESESHYCVMWTSPAGCYFSVFYTDASSKPLGPCECPAELDNAIGSAWSEDASKVARNTVGSGPPEATWLFDVKHRLRAEPSVHAQDGWIAARGEDS